MRGTILNSVGALGLVVMAAAGTSSSASAQSLLERAENGEPIRIGFSSEVPFAYPGNDGSPKGVFNVHTIGVLKKMGYEKIEAVVTEWGGLIPALNSNRLDIITAGMAITGARCENIAFSEPAAKVGDGFIVAPGNPKNISTYGSLVESQASMAAISGYWNIDSARAAGVPEENIMQVPGSTELLAAVKAGRADAGAGMYLALKHLADSSSGAVEVTDPNAMPEAAIAWSGIGFRKADREFVDKFNAAQAEYLGSEEMMSAVAEYGYDENSLPGDRTTEWLCANR